MTVADACAELATLAPMLGPALRRDATHTGGWSRFEATLSPVNTDVLSIMITLRYEIPAATLKACDIVGEPSQRRTLDACLIALPRLATRMQALNLITECRQVEDVTRSWVRQTKRALGLRKPDLTIPALCPACDTPPAGQLLMAGAEGFIRPGPSVEWVVDGRIWCPRCGAAWGRGEWDLLIKVLETTGQASA